MDRNDIVVLGTFVADLAFKAERLPVVGETLLGRGFAMGPGGKGSNQVIAAARAGARAAMVTRVGQDSFGEMARRTWAGDGIDTSYVISDTEAPTGAAFIFVSTETGDNAIIIESGAAAKLSPADISAAEALIAGAKVFVTQFEQPIATAMEGLRLARKYGVTTVLNPAPALPVDDAIYSYCDYVTPNETEAATLTGVDTATDEGALRAAARLVELGACNALITLGAKGAILHGAAGTHFVPAFRVANVIDTTGAGDAFNGGFAVAIAEGRTPVDAVRFGAAVAALSVQKPGTAPSMPSRLQIDAFLAEKNRGP
ncbi:ribokinase [Rhizobium sp. BR 315]|uniref:ribokinase n=1 Tax=Rhizobium sp. BR 315 TaxID=3040014 RepID=UPI003D349054